MFLCLCVLLDFRRLLEGADPTDFFCQPDEARDLAAQVIGRINQPEFFPFWRDVIRAPPHVLRWIKEGYNLDFKFGPPPPSAERNNASARDPAHFDFICDELRDLQASGAIVEVSHRPYIVLPIQVAVQRAKKRLIVDASRAINPWLTDGHVKLPTLPRVAPNVPHGAWLCTLDLKSGYYHWRVRPADRRFLGIAWSGRDGVLRYFQWTVTFLGLSTLVRDFTKVLRPLIAHVRRLGIMSSIYIDDVLIASASRQAALADCARVRRILAAAGWIDNPAKRQGPAQRVEYLGLVLNSPDLTIHVPREKLAAISSTLESAASTRRATVRDLARVAGQVVSLLQATGPSTLLLGRPLFEAIAGAVHYDQWIDWTPLWPHFRRLAEELPRLSGHPIHSDDDEHVTSSLHLSSDASANGLAVCQILCREGRSHHWHEGPCGQAWFRQPLDHLSALLSSTHRELLAIFNFLCREGTRLSGRRVTNWTDSANVERILLRGSRVPGLQRLALAIHDLARHHRIALRVFWVRRTDPRLQLADACSRFAEPTDPDDFGLSAKDFSLLQQASGRPFDFDLFASESNARCAAFASITEAPDAAFRDAFSRDWSELGFVYAHPPPALVAASIRKLVHEQASGVIVLPRWYTLPGWHLVCDDGAHVNGWALRVRRFQPRYRSGPGVLSPTFKGVPVFPTLAIWFGPMPATPFASKVSPLFCVDEFCSRCQ